MRDLNPRPLDWINEGSNQGATRPAGTIFYETVHERVTFSVKNGKFKSKSFDRAGAAFVHCLCLWKKSAYPKKKKKRQKNKAKTRRKPNISFVQNRRFPMFLRLPDSLTCNDLWVGGSRHVGCLRGWKSSVVFLNLVISEAS